MAQAAALALPLPVSQTEPDPGHPPPLRLATAPSRPRLEISPYAAAEALALERALGVGHVLAQILVRRGLADPVAARRFLDAGEAHDPRAFAGIERALDLIQGHIAAGRRIVVHGDYDVDGVCATAVMIRALRSLGADAGWFLPSRVDDGYGLSAATVERLAQRGTALIITVDCGITAVDEVAAARAARMDVVVCDHHAPRADGALPDCPIVHPALCDYPCPTLCGAAVAYKLAAALGAATARDDLDLVALATVADLVPLLDENRRLVREGLAALAATAKPGLRALMAVSRADPSALDTGTLGFRLAPRINAAGRLRRADAGLELVLTDDPVRAKAIAAELDARQRRAARGGAADPVGGRVPGRRAGPPASATCCGQRTGIRGSSGSSPRASSSATIARRCWWRWRARRAVVRGAAFPALTCSAPWTRARRTCAAMAATAPRPA